MPICAGHRRIVSEPSKPGGIAENCLAAILLIQHVMGGSGVVESQVTGAKQELAPTAELSVVRTDTCNEPTPLSRRAPKK